MRLGLGEIELPGQGPALLLVLLISAFLMYNIACENPLPGNICPGAVVLFSTLIAPQQGGSVIEESGSAWQLCW